VKKQLKQWKKAFFLLFFEKVCVRIKKGNNFVTQEYYPLE